MIRNIIFDWCGTLIDDLEAVWKATNRTFEQANVAPLTLEQFRAEFQLPFRPFYERYTPHCSEAQLEGWYLEAFEDEQGSVKPFPHSEAFLEYCQRQKIKTFVLSSIHPRHFETHLQLTGFDSLFHHTYVGVHDKRDQITHLIATHELAPEETLFVGDMQHDIETAKHGGTRSCAVLTGFNTSQQLQACGPDLIVEHLAELQRILESSQGSLPDKCSPPPRPKRTFPLSTVGALIFDSEDRVLMIQTHKWSNKWGIPGGKIQWGESALCALRREILEETHLEVDDIEFIMVQDAVFSPEFFRREHFILLNYTCRARPPFDTRLNHEAQQFKWVSPKEALSLDLNEPTRRLLQTVLEQATPTLTPQPGI